MSPVAPKHPCSYPGCAAIVNAGDSRCEKHRIQIQREYDRERGSSASRGYDSKWRAARKAFRTVLKEITPAYRPALQFAYLTGWRFKSEILTLQWRQVDFESGEVRLEPGTTRNREGRTFPFGVLPEERVLRDQRVYTDEIQKSTGTIVPWVFHRLGTKLGDYHWSWTRATEKAGLPGKIVHDFRRTAVRNLERAGVPRSVAMKLVGHKTESIYRRYAIVARQDLVDGLKRLADYRASIEKNKVMIGCCTYVVLKPSEGTAKIAEREKTRIGPKLLKTFQMTAIQ